MKLPKPRKSRATGNPRGRPRIYPGTDKYSNGQPEIRFRVDRELLDKVKQYATDMDMTAGEWARAAFMKEVDRVNL